MGIDDRGHDGFAREVHPRRPGRQRHLTLSSHARNAVVLHEDRGAFDHAAVAKDQSLAVEQDTAPARGGLPREHPRGRSHEQQRDDSTNPSHTPSLR